MRRYLEDAESIALMDWAAKIPFRGRTVAQFLMHTPNGGKRNAREAARLKRMGVRAGWPDYFFHVPLVRVVQGATLAIGGLLIELKAGDYPRATESQLEQIALLTSCGYETRLCHGWIAAAREICAYAGIEIIWSD